MLILFWDHKASRVRIHNTALQLRAGFAVWYNKHPSWRKFNHSHFNDKVQLHASHCIIQTLLFHSRHKITQADRERERAESGVIWISVCLLTHAHPKLIKPRNRGASPLLQTSGDTGAEQSQTRWRAGLWGGERIRKHSLLLDWAPWGHGSPSLPRVSECTMCCLHKRMKYMCNLFTEAKPPSTHSVLSFSIIIHIHDGAGAWEKSALLIVAALRGALNCSNMYSVCVGGPAPPACVCKLPLKTTYSEGIAHLWRTPVCINKILAHRRVVAVMNMLVLVMWQRCIQWDKTCTWDREPTCCSLTSVMPPEQL